MSETNPNEETASFAVKRIDTDVALTLADTIDNDAPANTQLLVDLSGNDVEKAGTLITKIRAEARATVVDTAIHLFISDDGGTTQRLIATTLMKGYTVSATTAPEFITTFKNTDGTVVSQASPMELAAGSQLYVGIGVALAEGIVISSSRVDF